MEKKLKEKNQRKIDKKQTKELAEEILASLDALPAKCPECGKPTEDEWRMIVRRREYPDTEGFDVELSCETCSASFCPEKV